jgi:hypothetical protein
MRDGCAGPVDLVGGGNPSGQKPARGRQRKPPVGADIVPDERWPNMWRVTLADGSLSDMMSPARAKDAALAIADDSWAKMGGSGGERPAQRTLPPASAAIAGCTGACPPA